MQQCRANLKESKLAARRGDRCAALQLLGHSVACGHERLSIRRYFIAHAMGAANLEYFRSHCRAAAAGMTADGLLAVALNATQHICNEMRPHEMTAELLPPAALLILPYEKTLPQLATELRFCGEAACVIGKTKIGARAALAAGVVIRADGHFVQIGDDFCIGQNATVHIAHAVLPTVIGSRVTVGRNAVVHACTVGDDCIIDDSVVVLDGSLVENNVIVEPGSIVFPRSKLITGHVYAGCPAKPVREVRFGECAARAGALREAIAASVCKPYRDEVHATGSQTKACFVARNARLAGPIDLQARSSVFFSCNFDAGKGSIIVGKNTNIQDNTVIRCADDGVTIGDDTTIGHNVLIHDSQIGSRSLVGIGSVLSSGTIVEDDVLLAAGAVTSPYQILTRGLVWGGRPARPIAELDPAKRSMMSEIIGHYCAYGDAYRLAQNNLTQSGESNGPTPVENRHAAR